MNRFFRIEDSIFFFIISAAVICVSCASTPKKSVGGTASDIYSGSEEKISISTPKTRDKKRTYFSRISEDIMSDIENASPASLRRAVSKLRKPEDEYEENEKVLFSVAAGIMKIVWPTERADWEQPELSAETSYTGAINSAGNGIYDTSTGNVDFLTIVLPSLVILTVENTDDFFTLSETALLQGLKMRPASVLANYLLGQLYMKNSMYSRALPYFEAAVNGAPECLQTSCAYAECLQQLNRIKEANTIAISLVSRYPSNIDVLRLCAETSFILKNYNGAEEYIARILQQDPNDLAAVLFRARVLIEKKDYIHAASLLDVYSRQDSTSKDYLLLRAQVQYDWSKNTTAAAATIETALKNYPDDKDVLLFAARLAVTSGIKVGGRSIDEYADSVLALDPENETALQYAAEGFVQNSNWQKAYSVSQAIIAKGNPTHETVFRHVKICLALGRKEEAWNLIGPLYREFPNDEEVVQSYILTLCETDRGAQALQLINNLLPDSQSRMKSFLLYRRSFLKNSEADVLSDLRSSLIANPRNSDALFRLYEIYYDKRDYRKAQYYLKQVVALNPNDSSMRKLNDELSALIK